MDEYLPRLHKIIEDSEKHCYVTRNMQVQTESIKQLEMIKKETIILKKQAIQRKDERDANELLSIEWMIRAMINELTMYVNLKNNKAQEAWVSLIDAQDSINSSIRAFQLSQFDQDGYAEKLLRVEKVLFPPQSFMSPSWLFGKADCSICKKDYGECGHIAGEPYMGEFCIGLIKEIKQMFHIALVSHPADKRRTVSSFSEGDGLTRDYMTWNLYKDENFTKLQKSTGKTKT